MTTFPIFRWRTQGIFKHLNFSEKKSIYRLILCKFILGTLYKSETTTETFITTSFTDQKFRNNNPGNSNSTNTSSTIGSSVATTSTNTILPGLWINGDRFRICGCFKFWPLYYRGWSQLCFSLYDDSYYPGPKGFCTDVKRIFRIFKISLTIFFLF